MAVKQDLLTKKRRYGLGAVRMLQVGRPRRQCEEAVDGLSVLSEWIKRGEKTVVFASTWWTPEHTLNKC
jgi:hypothetical protein